MERESGKVSLGQRWMKARPTKTLVFWSWLACAALTMLVGFTWGEWVRGATARSMAEAEAEDAVVKHLAPICVANFQEDPVKDQKLTELRALSIYDREAYVKRQGWARMPGQPESDSKVAGECAKLISHSTAQVSYTDRGATRR